MCCRRPHHSRRLICRRLYASLRSGFIVWTALILIFVGCGKQESSTPSLTPTTATKPATSDLRDRLNQLINSQRFDAAEKVLHQLMVSEPDNADYYKTAAFIQGRTGRANEAAKTLTAAVNEGIGGQEFVQLAIRANMESGRLFETIAMLENVVRRTPKEIGYRRTLIGFLGEAQLMDKIPTHLQPLIQARQFDAALLETVVLTGRRFSTESLEALAKRNPNDKRLLIADAAAAIDQVEYEAALLLLEEMVEQHPDFSIARGMLARCLAMLGRFDEFEQFEANSTGKFERTADWYFAMGMLAQHRQKPDDAVRSMFQAFELRPNDPLFLTELTSQLNQWLPLVESTDLRTDISDTRAALATRQARLGKLLHEASDFSYRGRSDAETAEEIANILFDLGRLWESEAWSAIAMTLHSNPKPEHLSALRDRVLKQLAKSKEWQQSIPDLLPAPTSLMKALDERSPLVDQLQQNQQSSQVYSHSAFALENQAEAYGIRFNGHTGPLRFGPMVPLSDSLGCGAGVIDYDLDGHDDLYLAAAGGQVNKQDSQAGALMRRVDLQYSEITQQAGCVDHGFGQGVAISDFNQDGFDDLYVLNFGLNRCFQNNGDGTFRDVTEETGLGGDKTWSSSGAWIDLNRDGLLDLIVCNYIDDDSKVAQQCHDANGDPAPCSPLDFPPAKNQFFAGTPDSGWTDVTDQWNADPLKGRSLGVLAGRLDSKRFGVFVANDMSANTLLLGPTSARPTAIESFALTDESFLSGLALDGRGRTQASMGIAAEDIDQDGDLDFLVTGFDDEYHVVYRQQSPGVWTDQSSRSDMVSPTLRRVGFGVKAIDLDNNGRDEWFVANGHVSGGSPSGASYEQTIDLFAESSPGRYERIAFEQQSQYCSQPHVGRCVVPMDVDHDGRIDLLITHVTEPPALLMNRTPTNHLSTSIRLVATQGSREAYGAIAEVNFQTGTGERTRSKQLLSGNGYLISPPRELRFSFPEEIETAQLTVNWPDGRTEFFEEIQAGRDYLVVQRHSLIECKTHQRPNDVE